jgi:hypothetical protein
VEQDDAEERGDAVKRYYDFIDAIDGRMAACICALIILGTAFVVMPACGASSQEKALVGTMATINAAEVTFVQWDGKHQLDIVAACDQADGKTACDLKLHAYRAQRDKTLTIIKDGYLAVDAAFQAINDKTVATAIAAGVAVAQALQALGVK